MPDFYCDEVLGGKTSVTKLMETDSFLAFEHTRPSWTTHVVLIPKQHIGSLVELNDQELTLKMISILQKLAKQITQQDGSCKIITNLGDFQDSKHLHWHLVAGTKK